MKSNLALIAVCVAVLSLLIGTAGFSFANAQESIEGVQDTSDTLLFDITSINLFAYVCGDFFAGADSFHVTITDYDDGSAHVVYQSFDIVVDVAGMNQYEVIRTENFPLYREGDSPSAEELERAWKRIYTPIKPFIEWEKSQYNGAFADVVNAVQYIGYILGMIWGIIALLVLVLIDTTGVAWELLSVALAFVGLA